MVPRTIDAIDRSGHRIGVAHVGKGKVKTRVQNGDSRSDRNHRIKPKLDGRASPVVGTESQEGLCSVGRCRVPGMQVRVLDAIVADVWLKALLETH